SAMASSTLLSVCLHDAHPISGKLLEGEWLDFCQQMGIDQYFAGIDTLLHARDHHFTYELALKLDHFNKTWQYQEGRKKLIWEIRSEEHTYELQSRENIVCRLR